MLSYNRLRVLIPLLIALLALTGIITAQQEDTPLIPPEVEAGGEAWVLANYDYANTRAASGSGISASTANEFEVIWSYPIAGSNTPGDTLSTPLVSDSIVYFQDAESNVVALSLENGDLAWESEFNTANGVSGAGIGYGHVFVSGGDNSITALELATGEEAWTFETPNDRPIGETPSYAFAGYVYVTSQTGDADGTSAYVYALDATTGEIAWEFQVLEEGFWGNDSLNSGGNITYPPAIDTNRDLLIWGTGSPAPAPGTVEFPNAASRTEPNLYTNSVVALDPLTGDLKWHNHVNPNDLFNHDVRQSPVLATISQDEAELDIVIGAGTSGEIIAMDRVSGEELWRTPVGQHQNDDLDTIPEGITVTVSPGVMGGVSSPMAFSDGIVFATVLNLPTAYTADASGATTGAEAMQAALDNTDFGTGTSELVALDATSGIILWSQRFDAENYSGATVVNDLVFTATVDGMVYAFNTMTGEEVVSFEAPAGINGAPAVTGDTMLFPAGLADSPALIALRSVPQQVVQQQGMAVPPPPEAETAEDEADEVAMEGMDHGDMDMTDEEIEAMTTNAEPTAVPQVIESAINDPAEYISLGEGEQVINLNVISSVGGVNNGLNFNGYANGAVIVNVPEGWTVNVNFENRSNFPHSVAVVPVEMALQRNIGEPAFEGAATDGAQAGIIGSTTFTFVAEAQGDYAIACAVPSHSLRGQWWYFNVIGADQQPSVQIADMTPFTPGQ